jgi:endonuclease/exonuclease/phosphatase family metal-dependent hydrolase
VGTTHAHVNRSLRREFEQVLGRLTWDVVLLQEAPPRWLRSLCRSLRCHGALALTARNFPALPRALVAELVPDLIAANEGGSNQLLVRPPWRIVATRRHTLVRRWPERRRMLWARLAHPDGAQLAVANVHGTTFPGPDAERRMIGAAELAVEWSEGLPLVFGGDLNMRPRTSGAAFAELRDRLGLTGPTGADAIDHLLVFGAEAVQPAEPLAPEHRDVAGPRGRALRLSDHAPVMARVRVGI